MADCVEPSWSGNGAFGTPDVKDPVQGGVLKNCSLIAAFSSLAWKQKISAQSGPIYSFKFYRKDQYNNTIEDVQQADGILPLDEWSGDAHDVTLVDLPMIVMVVLTGVGVIPILIVQPILLDEYHN